MVSDCGMAQTAWILREYLANLSSWFKRLYLWNTGEVAHFIYHALAIFIIARTKYVT